jgi:hypothetical protein
MNSLNSSSKKQKMDRNLCNSDLDLQRLREELNEKPKDAAEGSVQIINSIVTESNIISAQGNATVSVRAGKVFI